MHVHIRTVVNWPIGINLPIQLCQQIHRISFAWAGDQDRDPLCLYLDYNQALMYVHKQLFDSFWPFWPVAYVSTCKGSHRQGLFDSFWWVRERAVGIWSDKAQMHKTEVSTDRDCKYGWLFDSFRPIRERLTINIPRSEYMQGCLILSDRSQKDLLKCFHSDHQFDWCK